uniref:Uncharacterized protein n=1 Tax=Panagrolaimus sp. JU765 TaxID=591449 RepID=A0AC34QG53_9BILA
MPYETWDRLSSTPQLDSDEHLCFYSEKKIWLISKTYYPVPEQNWGHRIIHKGGYIMFYDLGTSKWSDINHFNKLTDEKQMEELVFTFKEKICVLLFENFGQIKFHQLAVFDEKENEFTTWNEFEGSRINIKNTENEVRNPVIMADGELPDGSKLLIASVEGTMQLFYLKIDFDSKNATIEKASYHAFDSMLIPIHAAAQGPFSIIEYSNRAACSVNWDPSNHQRLVIEQHVRDEVEPKTRIKGDPPRFAFTGAKLLSLLDNNRWLHIAGFRQKGMTGHEFRGEIWLLEFPFSNEPHWKQIDEELPPEAKDAFLAFDKKTLTLFVIDKNHGIFKKKLEI